MLVLLAKKTITLLALIDPVAMIPLFLAATRGHASARAEKYAKSLATTVCTALLVAGFAGHYVLEFFGISMGAMELSGGFVAFMLALAMIHGHEMQVKSTAAESAAAEQHMQLVPLGIPLLAGPAAFAYMMTHSQWSGFSGWALVVVPVLLVSAGTWAVFSIARRAERRLNPATLSVVEKLAGFILAAIAVEMMARGARSLFPGIAG